MELEDAIRRALPSMRVSSAAPDRAAYARDLWPRGLVELQSGHSESPGPSVVAWPESRDDVVRLVEFARARRAALVPFGAGSGVCGGAQAHGESIVVDLKRLAAYSVETGPELDAGPGALGITLEERLLEAGYTTGHYPSSILCSTVGGWVAARGAGQCSGRYGKIEDMLTRLEVVLGTGDVVQASFHGSAPEMLPLFVGSEGTLGIITRVGLRLHPAPRARAFSAFSFENVEAGIETLRALFQEGLRPAVARLYDPLDSALMAPSDAPHEPKQPKPLGIKASLLRALLHVPSLAARAMELAERGPMSRVTLVLMHEGNERDVAVENARANALCASRRGSALGEGPARAWYERRYHVSYRQAPQFRAGLFIDTMEVSATWSKLGGVYHAVKRALGEHVLVMAHLSHSYPDGGSIYFTFAGTEHDGHSSLEVYDRAWRDALSAAHDAGASLSHHHGVGRSKAPRLGEELGSALAVQRALKSAWDPDGILNPGVLLPEPTALERHEPAAAPTTPELDAHSGLARLHGRMTLGEAEQWLSARGHSLHVEPHVLAEAQQLSLDAWIARGMPGIPDRFEDPVATRLAGFTARLVSGRRFETHAAPRRAVGPDLSALFVGAGGRFGALESVWLGALPLAAPRAASTPFERRFTASLAPSEEAAWQHFETALAARAR
ncbi:MAG: FAD-binding oxidoreductase [Polyangiaceae bacterium]